MKETHFTSRCKVQDKITLKELPTEVDLGMTDEKAIKQLAKLREKLSKFQDKMYAHNRYSVLICIQGMDTSGKDSLIREVFKEFNPRGVVVQSFKTPNSAELEHDYLWRHYIALPERGKFTVFNRTHYENVLVTRVHPEYLLNENLPGIEKVEDVPADFWDKRMQQINNFEQHISENGMIVFKFFLHLSKAEQKKRLFRRLNKDEHNWKFSAADLKERELWDQYAEYYEEAINKTSTTKNPWYVIPSDNKALSRLMLAGILWEELQKYTDIKQGELEAGMEENIELYKEQLRND